MNVRSLMLFALITSTSSQVLLSAPATEIHDPNEDADLSDAQAAADRAMERATKGLGAGDERLRVCTRIHGMYADRWAAELRRAIAVNPELGPFTYFGEVCLAYSAGRLDEMSQSIKDLKKLQR